MLKFTAFLLLGLLLLYLAFRNTDIDDLRHNLHNASYKWIIVSFAASVAAFFSRARRWLLLVRSMGYSPRFRYVFHSLMAGYLANMALPRMGELTRCVTLGRREKIPVDKLVGTVITERIIDLLSLLFILLIMLAVSHNLSGPFLKENIVIPMSTRVAGLFASTSAAIITLTIVIAFPLLLYLFRKRIFGKDLYPKVRNFIVGMINGIRSFRTLAHKWEFLFHTIFIWLCYIAMTWAIVFVLPATSHLGFGDAVFLLVIGGLGMSAPVQSGLGAFHWIISRGLNLVYNIPLTDSLAYALISHTSQMILIALIGSVSLIVMLNAGRAKEKQPVRKPVENGKV